MKRLVGILLLILSVGLYQLAQAQEKPKDAPKKDAAKAEPTERAVPEAQQKELRQLFTDKEYARIGYEQAVRLLTGDDGSTRQTLLLFQRDFEAKQNLYLAKVLLLRAELEIPKAWNFDLQGMRFVKPQ